MSTDIKQELCHSKGIMQKNQFKLYFYMFVTTVILGILGIGVSSIFHLGLTGTGVFLLVAGIINFVAYYYSDTLIIKSENAKPIEEKNIPDYHELVKDLCDKNNLKMPRLYMVNSPSINAFATGRNIEKGALVITRGALEKLSPDEIRGVVGHELAHIENEDMKLMSILSILTGIICILADMCWVNNSDSNDESGTLAMISIILALLAPITSILIKLSVSRSREYVADARGAEIVGNPDFLAKALMKIKKDRIQLPHINSATAHLYLASPFRNGGVEELFSTHPDIDNRIERLKNMKLN